MQQIFSHSSIMFCCLSSSTDDPVDTVVQTKKGVVGIPMSSYPGFIRNSKSPIELQQELSLVQTGGNALMVYNRDTLSDVVKVVVPANCYPGQMIQVIAPNDEERVLGVVIPRHCTKPGSCFLVQFPPPSKESSVNVANEFGINQDSDDRHQNTNNTNDVDPLKEPLLQDHDINDSDENKTQQISMRNHEEERILITVPRGADAGSTIYAKIPSNDNRYVPVKVPKGGISQFYISYTFAHTINKNEMIKQQANEKEQLSRKNQNWHDNPIAYGAPMVVLPLLT